MTAAATALAHNRIAKATRLADALIEAGADSLTLTLMGEPQWCAAALAAHCSVPSAETRALVSQLIAARKTRRRKTI
jgi:hypothetical protein